MAYTGQNQLLEEACRSTSFSYAQGKSIQCRVCKIWLYTQERGASAEYEALGSHLVDSHLELHGDILERYKNSR